MPLGRVHLGRSELIPRQIPPSLAHEQGAIAFIHNSVGHAVLPYNTALNPTQPAAEYIQEYAARCDNGKKFVKTGILVTLGDKVLFHLIPDGPPKRTSSCPSEWNGDAAEYLLWLARNALNPNFTKSSKEKRWHDDGVLSSYTPNEFLSDAKLDPAHPFYAYGHYMVTTEQGGVLGWLFGKTNPPKEGPRYHGMDWEDGLRALVKGARARPIDGLLVAYRMGERYGHSVRDVLLDYFKDRVPEWPAEAAIWLPELDEKGRRVKMLDHASETLIDNMIKSDSPFVRTNETPYPFHDKPLLIVAVPVGRWIYGLGDKFQPKAVLMRYYQFWMKKLSLAPDTPEMFVDH